MGRGASLPSDVGGGAASGGAGIGGRGGGGLNSPGNPISPEALKLSASPHPPAGRSLTPRGGRSTPNLDPRDHGPRLSLYVATSPARSWLSGPKAYWTHDRPSTPRWHTRMGGAAVPMCLWHARCLCVWGIGWRGSEARRVTRVQRDEPSPGSACLVGGGGGLLAWRQPPQRAPRGGGGRWLGRISAFSALAQRGTTRRHRVSAAVVWQQA